MAELKPCPFCGRTPTVDDCGDHRYFVRCKCGVAQDKLYMQKCDAVRRWNTRKTGEIAKDTNVPSNDCISRQEAIDALEKAISENPYYDSNDRINGLGVYDVRVVINDLPSAQPERKKGRWINAECKDGTTAHKCSECRKLVGYSVSSLTWFNFCPWCGTDMRGEQDETD